MRCGCRGGYLKCEHNPPPPIYHVHRYSLCCRGGVECGADSGQDARHLLLTSTPGVLADCADEQSPAPGPLARCLRWHGVMVGACPDTLAALEAVETPESLGSFGFAGLLGALRTHRGLSSSRCPFQVSRKKGQRGLHIRWCLPQRVTMISLT